MYKYLALIFMLLTPAFTPDASAQSVSGLYDELPIADKIFGKADAPITIVEYASMTCPHCRAFHETVLPELKEKFIDTGKVKLIVRPFSFQGDRRGEAAFMLAFCAPNNNYYPMLDNLFSTQDIWADSRENPVPELKRLAKLAGMSNADFESCLGRQDLLDQLIESRKKAIDEFGVNSTPTLFINNRKFSGNFTFADIEKTLNDLL